MSRTQNLCMITDLIIVMLHVHIFLIFVGITSFVFLYCSLNLAVVFDHINCYYNITTLNFPTLYNNTTDRESMSINIGFIDFEKAFDFVKHECVFNDLDKQGVEAQCIQDVFMYS